MTAPIFDGPGRVFHRDERMNDGDSLILPPTLAVESARSPVRRFYLPATGLQAPNTT